jgi:fatty acid desaturase
MSTNADFIALKQIVKQRGLLDKQPAFYVGVVILKFSLFMASVVALFLTDSVWFQMANAIFFGFIMAQVAFTSHSACHRQCFNRPLFNDLVPLFFGNLLLGISRDWWTNKHNVHHAHPNHDGMDPDLDVPVVVFTEEQARSTRGFVRFMVRNQAWLFFPLLTLQGFALREVSMRTLIAGKARQPRLELLLIAINIVWYISVPIIALGPWLGLAFVLVSNAVFGVYMGSVFAPNHKGMLIVDDSTEIDYLRLQVLTARNVSAHPLTDFWYGGLNYQIEHHLFPSLPMHRLREVSLIVKEFCAARGISYHETSMLRSYWEILTYLNEIGSHARAARASRPRSRSSQARRRPW